MQRMCRNVHLRRRPDFPVGFRDIQRKLMILYCLTDGQDLQ